MFGAKAVERLMISHQKEAHVELLTALWRFANPEDLLKVQWQSSEGQQELV